MQTTLASRMNDLKAQNLSMTKSLETKLQAASKEKVQPQCTKEIEHYETM